MSIFDSAISEDSWLTFDDIIGRPLHVKLEGCQPSGSIKIKTALGLFRDAKIKGLINSETTIVESSSGNLGVALAMICANNRIKFRCFVDPNISSTNAAIMKSLGAILEVVSDRDTNGGYLESRISALNNFVANNPNALWLNQYANPAGPLAHYETTAAQIHRNYPDIRYLLVGAGTTGTLMGCARYFKDNKPDVRVVAVDVAGSVTFRDDPGPRYIPGLGTSRKPELVDPSILHDIVHVDEPSTIKMCRSLARRYGVLFGGSTGSVIAGIKVYANKLTEPGSICTISPDFGEKYLSTIYDDDWVQARFANFFVRNSEACYA